MTKPDTNGHHTDPDRVTDADVDTYLRRRRARLEELKRRREARRRSITAFVTGVGFPASACALLVMAVVIWRQLPHQPSGDSESGSVEPELALVLPAAKPEFEATRLPDVASGLEPFVAKDLAALTDRLLDDEERSIEVSLAELPDIRLTLLRAYALVRREEAAPELIEVLRISPYYRERLNAIQLLGSVGPQSAMLLIYDEIMTAWEMEQETRLLILALTELSIRNQDPIKHAREVAEGLLLIAERHENAHVRMAAASAVVHFPRRNGISEIWIVDRLAELGFERQAISALSFSGLKNHRLIIDAIDTILDRKSSEIHQAIQTLRRLAPIKNYRAEEALLSVLLDDSIPMNQRHDAAVAYGTQTGTEGARRVLGRVGDVLLAQIVRRLPPGEVLEFAEPLDPDVYPNSLQAMVQLFYKDRSALEKLASDQRLAVRREAQRIIRLADNPPPSRRKPDPAPNVAELLAARTRSLVDAARLARSDDPDDQIESIRLIASIGAFELLPELVDMTWSQHNQVQLHARAVANAMLTSPGLEGPVESVQTTEDGRQDVFARILGGFVEGMSQSK